MTQKHKNFIKEKAAFQPLQKFIPPVNDKAKNELTAKEATYAYHCVRHCHSYRSEDCHSGLVQKFWDKKYSSGRTKTECIIKNVLAPYSSKKTMEDVKNVSFVTVLVDASNHNHQKIYPISIRYFATDGIKIKIINVLAIPDEKSITTSREIEKSLDKYNLRSKLSGLVADNTNSNSGGANRNGTNNILCRLQDVTDQDLYDVGCIAHIVHNGIQQGSDAMNICIETICFKLWKHFSIYTTRVTRFEKLCLELDDIFKLPVKTCKVRWLSLGPALKRLIDIWLQLYAFFEEEEAAHVLKDFFKHKHSLAYVFFLSNLADLFEMVVKRIEGDNISIVEGITELDMLIIKLKNRRDNNFMSSSLKVYLDEIKKDGFSTALFDQDVKVFYSKTIQYLEKWKTSLDKFRPFLWVQMQKVPPFKAIENSALKLNTLFKKCVNTDQLIDEYAILTIFVESKGNFIISFLILFIKIKFCN